MTTFDYFRYGRLGLTTNPFRTLTPDELAFHAVIEPDLVSRVASRPPGLLQFMGPEGAGKSTYVHAIRIGLGDRARWTRVDEHSRLPEVDERILLLDCLQRLPPGERPRLESHLRRHVVVAATHVSFDEWCRERSIPCETMTLGPRDSAWIQEFFRRRLDGAPWKLSDEACLELVRQTGGSPLRIEQRLYLTFEHLADQRSIDRTISSLQL